MTPSKISYLPDIQRLLPQAPEAEFAILVCFAAFPNETLAVCQSHGLESTHFHIPAHGIIYRCLADLKACAMPVDFVSISSSLRDAGKLEAIGGVSMVSSLFTGSPVASNLGYYVGEVLSKATARALIHDTTEIAARAYDGSEDPSALSVELIERTAKANRKVTKPLTLKLRDAMFHPGRSRPASKPLYGIGGTSVLYVGDILCVEAQVKSGKTAFVSAAIAATMAMPEADCLGWQCRNPEGHGVVHFDTEQSGDDHDALCDRVLARAGISRDDCPGWWQSYCVTGFSILELKEAVKVALDLAKRVCGGVHSLIIDGIADLVPDVNDPVAAGEIIAWLMAIAQEWQIGIFVVLHLNPISAKGQIAKARGHLGSQLYRKAAHVLRIEKGEDGVSNVTTIHSRKQPVPKDYAPAFVWSDEKKRHVSAQNNAFEMAEAKRREYRDMLEGIFLPGMEVMKWSELTEHVMKAVGCSRRTAQEKVSEMVAVGVVSKDRIGNYSLAK